MTLADLSIRRPVFAWMLMIGLMVFGTLSFRELGVSQLPDVDFPVVSINVSLPGAAPEVIETQVVDIIEDAVMEIQGIRTVTSNSRQGSANIAVEFDLGRNIDVAIQELENHISHVRSSLPDDLNPPIIRKQNPEDQPILWLALTGPNTVPRDEMMRYARNTLFNQFATVDGVGDISLGGYVDTNLRVWLSAAKLAQYQLTVTDVTQAIASQQVDVPSGRLEDAAQEQNVRLSGEAKSPREIGDFLVETRGGGVNFRPVPLKALGRIEEGLADVRRISRSDGRPAVGLGVMKQHGANAVEVADRVREKLNSVAKMLPEGYQITVRNDSTRFIKEAVSELNFTLILSALATSAVCLLFLGSLSSTFNILLAIPTSIIGAFIVLRLFHFTLNTFTLLGLSLAIGIVVDDAIMMLENIVRHREMGKPKRRAALDGAREITFAATAATLAVVAIFLPVIFVSGIIGAFLFCFGITVTAAVLLSLLEALTLTPMRCSQFLVAGGESGRFARLIDRCLGKLEGTYAKVLSGALRWPLVTVFIAFLILTPALLTVRDLPGELTPPQDIGLFLVRVKLPVGSALERTDATFRDIEGFLAKMPAVSGVFTAVGGFGGDAVNEGMAFVSLKPLGERQMNQGEAMQQVRKDLTPILGKGIKLVVQDMSLRGFGSGRGFPVEVNVIGRDWDGLGQVVESFMARLGKTGILTDINSDYQIGMPEIQVIPDRAKASARGVQVATIAKTINALIGGAVLGPMSRYPKDGHKYDIRVRLEGHERVQAEDLSRLKVRNNRGELINLSDVVAVSERRTAQTITRIDRQRAVKIYANVAQGHAQKEALATVEQLAKDDLPPGYSLKISGSAQTFKETGRSLAFAMVLGLLVAYMVLASQFNSFIHPVSVLMAMPPSLAGAFLGLRMAHQSINMFSMIGLILLMGIVKKNSILLVDFTNQVRAGGGIGIKDALIKACPLRLRPILMTSLATIAGAIPAAMALGPGSETRVPMAVALIGGVSLSTLLTLVVVPAVYAVLARFERA